jgi:hypothetical protein
MLQNVTKGYIFLAGGPLAFASESSGAGEQSSSGNVEMMEDSRDFLIRRVNL